MELLAPDSNFYAKEYLESLAVARMLVQLDMDDEAQIIRRDKPDVAVHLKTGDLFVEVRLVGQESVIAMPRHVEKANIILLKRRRSDPAFDKLFDGWTVIVRVDFVPEEERDTAKALANEMESFIRDTAGKKMLGPVADTKRYPLLTRYRGIANLSDVIFKTHTMIECGEPSWSSPPILDLMLDAITEKRRKAKVYDPACRPMWLLLSVVDERHMAPLLHQHLRNALTVASTTPFEKIVIIGSGMTPVIVG